MMLSALMICLTLGSQDVELKIDHFLTEPIYWAVTKNANNIAISTDKNIYLFDLKGNLKNMTGGPGDGPGQFQFIAGISFVNDELGTPLLAVFDARRLDITIFDLQLTYISRFSKTVRNIFPSPNGLTLTDLSMMATLSKAKDAGNLIMVKGMLSYNDKGKLKWRETFKILEFSEKLKSLNFAWSQHHYTENSEIIITGFSLEPTVYYYKAESGELIKKRDLALYRFVETPSKRTKGLSGYNWYSTFSEIFKIYLVGNSTFAHYSVPKNNGEIIKPLRMPSLPTTHNHYHYIQNIDSMEYMKLPDNSILLGVKKKGGFELEILEFRDDKVDTTYLYRRIPFRAEGH